MTTINRITGLATGIDTDQMVKDMLTSEQNKIDRVYQQQTLVEWKQEEYREIITEAKDLYSKYFDVLSKDSIVSSSAFSTTTVSSSNNSVITATAMSGAIAPNYNFDVKSSASAAQLVSTSGLSKSDTLESLGLTGETSFVINYGDGKSSSAITISKNDTIETLTAKINEASNGNFKATFSEMTGSLSISSSGTGASSKISISSGTIGADGSFVADGNSDTLSFLGIDGKETLGTNAVVVVSDLNGNQLKEISSESNSFVIDNVKYTVNGIGSARLTSSTDTTSAVEKMKNFVNDYNNLIDRIYSNLTAKKNTDYPPLTEAQKEEMSKEEIEKWEEKAKEGMLRGDRELKSMLDNLTNAISGTLADYGIKLSSEYSKSGQLSFDEEKFKTALIDNGAQVTKDLSSTFNKVSTVFKDNVGSSSSTLIKKAGLKNTTTVSNNTLSDEIKKYKDRISELTRKMNAKETALYAKFAALESAMNKFNSQMNYLSM